MTSPKHAHDTDNGRYYTDPAGGPDLVSVTNVLDSCINKRALIPWAVKLTVEHVLDNHYDVTARAENDRPALTQELKAIHGNVKETAADLGDRIHAAAEARILGKPIANDAEVAPYLTQFEQWLTAWTIDPGEHVVAAEITALHRRLGYAGTADLMVWLPTGPGGRLELWLIDYKSSATRSAKSVYPENTLQLAALRYAEVVLLPDDTEQPMPKIQRTGVLNLRVKSHALVEMPAGRLAHRAFRGALETTKWLHAAPSAYPALLPPAAEPTNRKAA